MAWTLFQPSRQSTLDWLPDPMETLRLTLRPRSAFGTALKGDTLFGQLCWALHHRFGDERLKHLLQGYADGSPFAVMSDALPEGHLPRPTLPARFFDVPESDRKALKRRVWLPVTALGQPLSNWLALCVEPAQLLGGKSESHPQPHNSLHHETNTTGNGFDPYTMEQIWFGRDTRFEVWVVFDAERISANELVDCVADIGASGFGRDASIGLGKLDIDEYAQLRLPGQPGANAWLTLGPSAPQGLAWQAEHCFYQPFTRFGRHGDAAVHSGKPFKTPVLLADRGAVLRPAIYSDSAFCGRGLGGDGSLSKAMFETVHQGYAPVVGIKLPNQGNEA